MNNQNIYKNKRNFMSILTICFSFILFLEGIFVTNKYIAMASILIIELIRWSINKILKIEDFTRFSFATIYKEHSSLLSKFFAYLPSVSFFLLIFIVPGKYLVTKQFFLIYISIYYIYSDAICRIKISKSLFRRLID